MSDKDFDIIALQDQFVSSYWLWLGTNNFLYTFFLFFLYVFLNTFNKEIQRLWHQDILNMQVFQQHCICNLLTRFFSFSSFHFNFLVICSSLYQRWRRCFPEYLWVLFSSPSGVRLTVALHTFILSERKFVVLFRSCATPRVSAHPPLSHRCITCLGI